jgi:hypothetical protein
MAIQTGQCHLIKINQSHRSDATSGQHDGRMTADATQADDTDFGILDMSHSLVPKIQGVTGQLFVS